MTFWVLLPLVWLDNVHVLIHELWHDSGLPPLGCRAWWMFKPRHDHGYCTHDSFAPWLPFS